MRISVIGCGYLGAVHAASMAKLGHEVVAVDVDPVKIERLAAGEAPFFEPGLPEILTEALASGRIRFTTDMAEVAGARVHFVAVGTPQGPTGAADLTYVDAAVAALTPHLSAGEFVVGKSTVPVGTAARLAVECPRPCPARRWSGTPSSCARASPCRTPSRRTASSTACRRCRGRAPPSPPSTRSTPTALANGTPRLVVDLATAELVKVSANAFLATKISFINAMAEIAEVVGADVTALADAIGHDDRIGRKFLNAGLGFGGGCLPKDIRAFQARANELGVGESLAFLADVDAINLRRRAHVVEPRRRSCSAGPSRASASRCSAWPSSRTPTTSATRPALDIAARLHELGATSSRTTPRPSAPRAASAPSSTTSRPPTRRSAVPTWCSC